VARQKERKEPDGLVEEDRGVFMISVAAELAGMHPQTLRVYEARGLIKPTRSAKQTRLYSHRDVERLRRIQELTTEFGMNLAGVERVLALERTMEAMHERLAGLERAAEQMEREMLEKIEAVHRSYRRELVLWEPPGEMLRRREFHPRIGHQPRAGGKSTDPRQGGKPGPES
jgi:MerR family transcriptional regulator, heat shock protein HspR